MSYAGVTFEIQTHNKPNLLNAVDKHFACYSVVETQDAWETEKTDGIIIRIVSLNPSKTRSKVIALARDIWSAFNLDVVVNEYESRVTIFERENLK